MSCAPCFSILRRRRTGRLRMMSLTFRTMLFRRLRFWRTALLARLHKGAKHIVHERVVRRLAETSGFQEPANILHQAEQVIGVAG